MNTGRNFNHSELEETGFTLVEILLALLLTALATALVYQILAGQNKVHNLQEQMTEMQQNLRATTAIMVRDIRMAGYHPQKCTNYASPADSGHIVQATANQLRFTFDTTDDEGYPQGDCDVFDREDIEYYLDGSELRRKVRFIKGSENKVDSGTLISNVNGLEFCYMVLASEDPTTYSFTGSPEDLITIRAVRITLLLRSSQKDPNKDYINKLVYQTPCGRRWGPFNDGYRRMLFTNMAWCRNLGS